MPDPTLAQILSLVEARRGHFRFESGYHGDQWLELDPLFVREARVRPVTAALATRVRHLDVAAVCGPLVGGAFVAQHVASALDVDAYYAEPAPPGVDRASAGPSASGGASDALFQAAYQLPRVFRSRVRGRRVAVVDDVISAGSSVRATAAALRTYGAEVVVVGGLLIMGERAADFFAPLGVPVVGVARTEITLWAPAECPLCAAGMPLEEMAAGGTLPDAAPPGRALPG
jgi:orotate phosphoribosyltransferase